MKTLLPEIDSLDKRFHAGNPATGEQGTRVTDTWLNDVQDHVRDVQAEAHYVLLKAGFKPVENQQTQLYDAIVKIIDDNRKTASLTQKGETKLYTGYDSQSEDLALTPKTAYQLKQLIDSNTRSLGNVIPNSKKSSAVDSNSEDTVANSKAVKKAYDKGVAAKTAADNAQRTADSKQSPATTLAGYGIGNFKIESFVGNVNTLQTDGIYAVTQASRSQNLPVADNDCHIQVIAGGDDRWCRQIAYIAYSTDMYERHQTSYQTDSWSAWARIDVRNEFDALKDIFIGVPIPYPLSTVPTGCLAMNGQRFDTRRYPKLAQKYPSGQLPDMRGEFIRGLDNGRGVDAGRGMLSVQSDEIKSHNHKFKYIGQNQRSESNRTDIFNQLTVGDSVYRHDRRDDLIIKVANESDVKYGKTPYNDVSIYINNTGGAETRPRNIAYHYICLAE
ncbi:tail fiber protein [Haemophilus haemolyticus]|uniref:tail fiber protein n=1 Tax=Haemophilus haemolyticus TaxID=726 RepID=UPI001EFCEB3E|nr:tail fiber protein [Haemophilus haemolyticus]